MMRLYLPGTLATVATLRAEGSVPATRAFAVTPALREQYATGGEEELEYVAFGRAAEAALHLLSAEPDVPRRRVVISVDADADSVTSGDHPASAEVRPRGAVPLAAVAAIHVDGAGAEPDVAAAANALAAAADGDEDAQLIVAAADDHELEWYDVSELAQLA